jgi:hypothetical protein
VEVSREMTDVIVLASQMSTPIKIAWLLWLAWAVVQICWYRWVRGAAPAAVQPAPTARLERTAADRVLSTAGETPRVASAPKAPVRRTRRAPKSASAAKEAIESIGAGVEKTVSA